jgi:deoxyribodipyrimidine photo-lyase
MSSLLWFRRDLRLRDNPALLAACAVGPVVPVYIHDPQDQGPGAGGRASQWWLHHSLQALDAGLRERGLRLVIRQGPALGALKALAREACASAVHWNRLYEPVLQARDRAVKAGLREAGLEARSHSAALLREPWELSTGQGRPYQVFTPFFRALLAQGPSRLAQGLPRAWPGPKRWPQGLRLQALQLLPRQAWAQGWERLWRPGEAGAWRSLKRFLEGPVGSYALQRDRPGQAGTSRLSPHLHFGELSPQQVWQAAQGPQASAQTGATAFLRELAWREFSHHLLHHFPSTASRPLRPAFERLAWRKDPAGLQAWQRGRTGYPIVDAGLRELWATGFMHNRVRMIAASFLVKDLLIDWRAGAAWFMDTLVDADLAQNSMGWQWVAGCGADAAPFFRVFNPVLQGEKFDPEGAYVRRWVPELAALPGRWVHRPWEAPVEARRSTGSGGYPSPIVDHPLARQRALERYKALKG